MKRFLILSLLVLLPFAAMQQQPPQGFFGWRTCAEFYVDLFGGRYGFPRCHEG